MLGDADLEQAAKRAVAAGLFDTGPDAVRVNSGVASKYERMPSTLLDVPYVNGPIFIEVLGRNIPEAVIFAVRRNFTEANRLLLPHEQVVRYIDQRLGADDVLNSEHLSRLVEGYRAPILAEVDARESKFFRRDLFAAGELDLADVHVGHQPLATPDRIGSRFRDPELSFQIKGVDRRSHVRALYTRDEYTAGLKLAGDSPAVVLAILAYQSVIQDYLAALRQVFESMASASAPLRDGLDAFDKYTEQWGTPNFTTELVPALAIFLRLQEGSLDETRRGRTIDAELFRDGVNFIVANGAFRHWIAIPPDIAGEEARATHFLCPAVGTVREQTQDGSLLEVLYNAIASKASAGENSVLVLLEKIRLEANQKLAESDGALTERDLARLQERLTMRLTYQGRGYVLALDAPGFQELIGGTFKRNDVIITASIGSWFYDVLQEAVATTLERKTAVFFQFNGRGYRLTPGTLIDFLRRNLTP